MNRIDLEQNNVMQNMKIALVHEMLHVIENLTQTDIGEKATIRISHMLTDAIKRNPEVFQWIASEETEKEWDMRKFEST